jgi:hypothetical protein
MAQGNTYFSQTNLAPGATSSAFTLPAMNNDGSGTKTFLLTVNRDMGLILPNGTLDANRDVEVTVQQLVGSTQTAVVTDQAIGKSTGITFTCNTGPGAGAVSILNNGPGTIQCVSIGDFY